MCICLLVYKCVRRLDVWGARVCVWGVELAAQVQKANRARERVNIESAVTRISASTSPPLGAATARYFSLSQISWPLLLLLFFPPPFPQISCQLLHSWTTAASANNDFVWMTDGGHCRLTYCDPSWPDFFGTVWICNGKWSVHVLSVFVFDWLFVTSDFLKDRWLAVAFSYWFMGFRLVHWRCNKLVIHGYQILAPSPSISVQIHICMSCRSYLNYIHIQLHSFLMAYTVDLLQIDDGFTSIFGDRSEFISAWIGRHLWSYSEHEPVEFKFNFQPIRSELSQFECH